MRAPALLALCLLAAGPTVQAAIETAPTPFSRPHHVLQDWGPPAGTWRPQVLAALELEASGREWENWRINTDGTGQVQNEQQVVLNPADSDNLVAVWRDFRLGHREVGVGYSFDRGHTWTDFLLSGPPQYPRHSDPGLTVDRFGNFYAVILSYVDTSSPNGLFVLKSTNGGQSWGQPVTVIDGEPGVFEDKELIACDRTGGAYDGNLYVAWARFYSTQIYCSRSTDGGNSFGTDRLVSDNGGVQWPVPVVGPDGVLYIAWVHHSPASIRLDRSFDGGITFGNDITVTSTYAGSDYLNGGILSYSYPAMDCDITGGPHHGRLYVAYMDSNSGSYDMFLRWSDDQGQSWSPRLRLNDDAIGNGRDQFHPWLSVGVDGSVHVVFYDRRDDPSNYWMNLYYTYSEDGGLSFAPNERVTTVSSDPNAGTRAGLIGEYIGLAAHSASRAHPVWTDMRGGDQDTYTAVIGGLTGIADLPLGASGLRVEAAAPNPFRTATSVRYTAAAGPVDAEVFDVSGHRVRRLRASEGADGAIAWDGRGDDGRRLGSGLYLLRVGDGQSSATARMLLLR